MEIFYAGIGSRETPPKFIDEFIKISKWLGNHNYILRSGGADGADSAFEKGCDLANGKKEIYLPWAKFNNNSSNLIVKDQKAYEIAEQYHPYWANLKEGARKLQARNTHQVLGKDFKTESSFIICWTKNGSGAGGTGQAIRIAKDHNIPIFDGGAYENVQAFEQALWVFIKEQRAKEQNEKEENELIR